MRLVVDNVKTVLSKRTIIEDISFSVAEGEVLALVGHNGAGKSTVMKTIMGMLEKAKGKITIDGVDQDDNLLAFKRNISYLPEEPVLLTELTVMQHFQLYKESYQVDEDTFHRLVDQYVKSFDLETKLNEFPESLSKGMRQKVQTICSFLPDVPVILIDEPFMGLDIYAVDYVLQLIKEKLANGTSILLTTHQLNFVKDLANEFVLLQDGQIIEKGQVAQFETITRGKFHD